MPKVDLEKLLELEAKATTKGKKWWGDYSQVLCSGAIICDLNPLFGDEFDNERIFATANFIAAMRNNIVAICEELKSSRAQIARFEKILMAARDLVIKATHEYTETELLTSAQRVEDLLKELEEK